MLNYFINYGIISFMELNFEGQANKETSGVSDVKIKYNECIISITWKDGERSVMHFPKGGFTVVNPSTNEKLGYIEAEKAIDILKKNVSKYDREDFSWRSFLNNGDEKNNRQN